MENSLRRIRKAAGYKSAKAFAEAIGMPPTTYSKYEQSADDGDISIPLKSAWTIADALGCSIDALVGREELPDLGMRGDVQRRYDMLSDDGKQLVDDFLNMAEMRETRAEKQRQAELARSYMKDARRYELKFLDSIEDTPDSDDFLPFGSDEDMRIAFKDFAFSTIRENREKRIEFECRMRRRKAERRGYALRDVPGSSRTERVPSDDPDYEEVLEKEIAGFRQRLENEAEQGEEEVIEGIMAAYDRMHPVSSDISYAVVSLE